MLKKQSLAFVITKLALLALVGCGQQEPSQVSDSTTQATQLKPLNTDTQLIKKLADTAKSENEKLPIMIDKQTRLDQMLAGPGPQLSYIYTLPNYMAIDISRAWIISDVRPQVAIDACGNKELRELLRKGTAIVYVYKGKDGIEINRFSVKQSDCVEK